MSAVLLAIAASLFWGIGNTLQKYGMAAEFPKIALRDVVRKFGLILQTLFSNWIWMLGLANMLAGMGLFATALGSGDITLVQPIVCLTGVVAAIGGVVFLKEKVTKIEWLGIGGILLGVVLVGVAGHGETSTMPSNAGMLMLNGAAIVLVIGALGLSRIGASTEFTLSVAAGVLFGLANVLGKLLTQRVIADVGTFSLLHLATWRSMFTDYPVYIVLAANVVAASLQQTAFANGRASVVTPILTIIANVLPIVAALIFFGEKIEVLHAVGIAVVVVGTASLGLKFKPKEAAAVPA
jgi:drug/metabolite transporter (DMT)-like permease